MEKITKIKPQQPIPKHAKCVFKGELFEVWQWEQELFDGSKTVFEKVKRNDTVMVIPVTEDGKVIVTKQKQPGMEEFICLAGGKIENDEDIVSAAKRELLEETGYETNDISLLSSQELNSYVEWMYYDVLAKGCKKVTDINSDAGEQIEVILLEPKEFVKQILSGEIRSKHLSLYFSELERQNRLESFLDSLKV